MPLGKMVTLTDLYSLFIIMIGSKKHHSFSCCYFRNFLDTPKQQHKNKLYNWKDNHTKRPTPTIGILPYDTNINRINGIQADDY